VNGSRASAALEFCKGSGVVVAAVVGFPLGASTQQSKINEAVSIISLKHNTQRTNLPHHSLLFSTIYCVYFLLI
jgi:hypothetical protein